MADGFIEPPSTLPSTPMDPLSTKVDDSSQAEKESVPFTYVEVGSLVNIQIPFPGISSFIDIL